MATSTDLKQRAQTLAAKTDINSIDPQEVGGLFYDLTGYAEDVQRNGGSLGIRKVYASVSAMEADSTSPKDMWGNPMRKGQLCVIYDGTTEGVDNNKVFAFKAPGWEIATQLDAGYATRGELTELEGKISNSVFTDNKIANSVVKEIYIENKQEGDYTILWVEKNYTGNGKYGISLKVGDSTFNFEYSEAVSLIYRSQIGQAKVSVVLNYDNINEGERISVNATLNDKAFDINYSPSIKAISVEEELNNSNRAILYADSYQDIVNPETLSEYSSNLINSDGSEGISNSSFKTYTITNSESQNKLLYVKADFGATNLAEGYINVALYDKNNIFLKGSTTGYVNLFVIPKGYTLKLCLPSTSEAPIYGKTLNNTIELMDGKIGYSVSKTLSITQSSTQELLGEVEINAENGTFVNIILNGDVQFKQGTKISIYQNATGPSNQLTSVELDAENKANIEYSGRTTLDVQKLLFYGYPESSGDLNVVIDVGNKGEIKKLEKSVHKLEENTAGIQSVSIKDSVTVDAPSVNKLYKTYPVDIKKGQVFSVTIESSAKYNSATLYENAAGGTALKYNLKRDDAGYLSKSVQYVTAQSDISKLLLYLNAKSSDSIEIELSYGLNTELDIINKSIVSVDNSEIDCIGDSITQGQEGINPITLEKETLPYPTALQNKNKNITVHNYGVGGQNATEIFMRLGFEAAIIKKGFTLPSDGSEVLLSTAAQHSTEANIIGSYDSLPAPYFLQQGTSEAIAQMNTIFIQGIECSMTYRDGNLYVKRKNIIEGSDIEISDNTPFLFNGAKDGLKNSIKIIFVGTNNDNPMLDEQSLVDKIDNGLKSIIGGKFLILGYVPYDSSVKERYAKLNSLLLKKYANKYIDVSSYMCSYQAFQDLGIAYTTDDDISEERKGKGVISDVNAIQNGIKPSTFWRASYVGDMMSIDKIHYNALGYTIIANLVYERLVNIGWIVE